MDSELSCIRSALIDTRVNISHQFQKMTQLIDKEGFGLFLLVYCRQAAALCQWMSEWNEQIRQQVISDGQAELVETFTQLSEKLLRRHHSLDEDTVNLTHWLAEHTEQGVGLAREKCSLLPGMKQLRFIFQECIKRRHYVNWLVIMSEIERLRIVHGFTLIKLCELYFGRTILRCFSHIHYQHQHENELFALCEIALKDHIELHTASVPSMITQARAALDAYACFIEDCYKASMQQVTHHVKSTQQ